MRGIMVQRRQFLAGAAAALFGGRQALAGPTPHPDAVQRWLALLSRPASARAVGQCYLRQAPPAERSLAGLLERLCEGQEAAIATASPERLRALVAQRQQRDFAQGRTVSVEGWVLSQTEARLYALAAAAG